MMTSVSSTRSESPVDIDFSVIRTAIQMGHKMIDQILNGIHYGSDEVRNLLREECDFILECKVCRNLFRSFPNFVAHKRVYCMEYFEEKKETDNLAPVPVDEETVVIQPEAPEDSSKNQSESVNTAEVANTNIEKVINKTFEGKSKEYQLYTKVAEDLEKRKVTKVTNTVTLIPIATTSKAVEVVHSKGDKSSEILQGSSPKKQSLVKTNEATQTSLPGNRKNSVLAICADLTKKKALQGTKEQASSTGGVLRISARSRKSSPRKSVEYLETSKFGGRNNGNAEEIMDVTELNEDIDSNDIEVTSENVGDKDWMKFCDVKNLTCKLCKRSFSSLYNLKFHAKMKHLSTVASYSCPHCEHTFDYFTSLARHLRKAHNKSESYINNIKMKLQRRKSTESMETNQGNDDSSSSKSSGTPPSPQKISGNLLSYSTGWKKCDRCGKVCWKAKSFYRHYATCKGPLAKESTKSASNSPVKLEKQRNSNGDQRNSAALLKLQEKLRAEITQPGANVENQKSKVKDRSSKSESEMKTDIREKSNTEDSGITFPELYKTLTKPLSTLTAESKPKEDSVAALNEKGQMKTYKLRAVNQNTVTDKVDDATLEEEKIAETNKNSKEVVPAVGSQAFKKLEERLVREAGLKDSHSPEKISEAVSKPYSTRHAGQSKKTGADAIPSAETKEASWKGRDLNVEHNKEGTLNKVKELKGARESPEIKELEEKLTREALGHKKQLDEKERNTDKKVGTSESHGDEKRRDVQSDDDLEIIQPEVNDESKSSESATRNVSGRNAESRKEKIPERLRERVVSLEILTSERKVRSAQSVSKESDTKEEKLLEKASEKIKLMTNLSPVTSPTRTTALPSSPTPSVQSSSGDSYNMKFKMTVQEMAELVESASLTKFAKERKKKARKILNKKQVKESQRVAASLSQPMKRQVKKRNIVVRNVYGTRNKKDGNLNTEESNSALSTRSSAGSSDEISGTVGTEEKKIGGRNTTKKSPKGETSALPGTVSSRNSSSERQTEKKRLSIEERRLLNSAGFVEENYYAVSSSRDSSKEKHAHHPSKDRYSRDSSKERLSLSSSKKKVRQDSPKFRHSLETSKGKTAHDSVKERASRDTTRKRHSKDESEGSSCRDTSKDNMSEDGKDDTKTEKGEDMRGTKKSESSQCNIEDDRARTTSSRLKKGEEIHSIFEEASKEAGVIGSEVEQTSKEILAAERATMKAETVDIANVNNVSNSRNIPSNDEKQKESSNVKKTILYVKKDFTERIKNIQKGKADGKQENVSSEMVIDLEAESDDEKTSKTQITKNVAGEQGKTSAEQGRTSAEQGRTSTEQERTSTEQMIVNKRSNATGKVTDSESQDEDTGKESKKRQISQTQNKRKSGEDELKDGKRQAEAPKHRTRLATGSIFFDSELLKLSPTKIEKKAAQLSKISEASKVNKGSASETGPTSVRKRLSLSPKEEILDSKSKHQRTGSAPQKYSLSTGVKQCQKCNKKFWKKKAYAFHMTNSPCSDKKSSNNVRKRAPSLSPKGKIEKEDKTGTDKVAERRYKKICRTETEISEDSLNEDNTVEDKTEQNEWETEERQLKKRKVDNEDKAYTHRLSGFEKEYVKFAKLVGDRGKNQGENSVTETDELTKGTVEDRKKPPIAKEEKISKAKKTDNKTETIGERSVDSKPEGENALEIAESNRKGIRQRSVGESQIEKTELGTNELKGKSADNSEVDGKKEKHVTDKPDEAQDRDEASVSDEVPGPSQSTSSVFSDDDIDDESDFSGFSEDDLKVSELELTHMDIPDQEDIEGEPEDVESDDICELSEDISHDDEGDMDTKSSSASSTISQRPVRKSAQNRFAHVEEIWVYKEPGKPVERTKGAKNREYVLDVKNPSKLQCHNTKDVDKLIDEKNLKCKQCETPCTSISNLRRHVIRHLGWKRYKCKHCTYTCYDMSYCRQHVLRAHDEKLTSKNFDKYIIDLKKEATKKRAAKRTSTLHKSKNSSTDEDVYRKQKTLGSNTVGQKVNFDQTKASQGSNIHSIKVNRKSLDVHLSDKSSADTNQVVKAEFIRQSEGKVSNVQSRKDFQGNEKLDLQQSLLVKARMNLAKALNEKP